MGARPTLRRLQGGQPLARPVIRGTQEPETRVRRRGRPRGACRRDRPPKSRTLAGHDAVRRHATIDGELEPSDPAGTPGNLSRPVGVLFRDGNGADEHQPLPAAHPGECRAPRRADRGAAARKARSPDRPDPARQQPRQQPGRNAGRGAGHLFGRGRVAGGRGRHPDLRDADLLRGRSEDGRCAPPAATGAAVCAGLPRARRAAVPAGLAGQPAHQRRLATGRRAGDGGGARRPR